MTSPTANPNDNDRYDGAIEELATELERLYYGSHEDDVALELAREILDTQNDTLVSVNDSGGTIRGTLRVELYLTVTNEDVVRACETVATRRINARLKSDSDFRTFIDSGKWPREEP